MKKKEMAALFDELGEAACKSRVMAFGKLPNGLSAESLDLAALAVASTFSFCAAVADGAADGAKIFAYFRKLCEERDWRT